MNWFDTEGNRPRHDLSGTLVWPAAPQLIPQLYSWPELEGSPSWQSQTGRVWEIYLRQWVNTISSKG